MFLIRTIVLLSYFGQVLDPIGNTTKILLSRLYPINREIENC